MALAGGALTGLIISKIDPAAQVGARVCRVSTAVAGQR